METLSLLPAGDKVLIKSMEGFYDMDNEKITKIRSQEGPDRVLVYKNGVYYALDKNQLTQEDIDFEELNQREVGCLL